MAADDLIKLVIFDWAGTTVDHGCFAPVAAIIEAFAIRDVEISTAEARGPMGLHKRDHIRAILEIPAVRKRWQMVHGADWTDDDVEQIYHTFLPRQAETARQHVDLIPGLVDCVAQLRERGIKIGTTTGYPREVAAPVIEAAAARGYVPDHSVCADEVPCARPAPWMVHRNMEALGVFPARSVVKVGDTVPDIAEGLNASVWSIGVTQSGSEVGRTADEFASLSPDEQKSLIDAAGRKLIVAGAHHVIPTVADLIDLLPEIEALLERGERP